MEMGMAPFTMAIFLVLLVGVDGVGRDDVLIPVIMSQYGKQRFMGGDASSRDLILETLGNRGSPPKDVPPADFFCHSCQEFSRKAENFLADPSLYDEARNLSTEVCQIVHSELQTKCRRLVELYLHEGILFLQIIFGEKNLCNGTGFCPMDVGSTLSLMSTPRGHRGRFPSMGPNFVPLRKPLLAQQSKVVSSWTQHSPLKARIRSRSCNACHSATDQILKELEDHDQQMAIMRALLGVCEGFKTYAARCKVWVFEYGPLFLANLHKFLISEDVCQLIHMCAEPAPPKRGAAGHLYLRGYAACFPTASILSLGQ